MKTENLLLLLGAYLLFKSKFSGLNGWQDPLPYTVLFAKKKGQKPAQAQYLELKDAEKFEQDLKNDGWITLIVKTPQ